MGDEQEFASYWSLAAIRAYLDDVESLPECKEPPEPPGDDSVSTKG